jgi:hypothetical protein
MLKNENKYQIILASYMVIAILCTPLFTNLVMPIPVVAVSTTNDSIQFNKDQIISNQSFTSYRDFPNEGSVQKYLESKNSVLAKYETNKLTAAQIIFRSANGDISTKQGIKPQISPAILLALIEKEQSLVSNTQYDTTKDKENRIKSATGYGCPDSSKCKPEYMGFYNQVTWAAYQLQANYTGSESKDPKYSPYLVGKSIKTLDNYNVTLNNSATAALYRYTPHVFWGNYNMFKIMLVNGWTINKVTTTSLEVDTNNKAMLDLVNCPSILRKKYKFGTNNESIKGVQKCLQQNNNFYFSTITGYYGPITNQGMIDYLSKQNACERFYYKNFRIGDTSPEVHQLQSCLKDKNLFPLPQTTGYYGTITNKGLMVYKN